MQTLELCSVTCWLDALVCVADGGLVTGADVVKLHGLLAGDDQPIYRRAVYEARKLETLVYSAMALARRLEESSGDVWLKYAVEFRLELQDATREGRLIAERWQRFAWVLGMDADFAAGLDRVGLLPTEG